MFFSLSNNVLLCNRICNKEELLNCSNLQWILFKVLRRVYRSSLNVGQWRRKCEVDSISKPQLQIGFKQSWKLCLNLCSRKWHIPTCSRVISLILGKGLLNFGILFLKTTKLFEFRREGSKLFHSMIVEGKKEFLKKLCLIFL